MSARATPAARLALALIILLACLLAAGCWRVYSNTWDEPEHLAAGVELLDRGRYEYDTEHPPLARLPLAIGPYLAGARSFGTPPPNGTPEGVDILYQGGHYWLYLTLARLGMLPFLALLCLATWLWARRLLDSPSAALLAVLLLVSVPPVLGNAGLASLDVAAAATCLLAFYALQQWLMTARLPDAARWGLAAGVAVGTKFSAVPFIGLALPALALARAAVARRRQLPGAPPPAVGAGSAGVIPRATPWAWLLGLSLAGLTALVPLALAYAPRSANPAGVALRFNWAVSYLLQERGLDHQLGVLLSHLSLPREAKDLINGVVAVKAHNDSGHRSYLLGRIGTTGWWYFYLVALAVKTPIPLLAAGPAGLAWLARDGWRRREPWALAPAVLTVTVLSFASVFSRINIGIRHVLVLYPFLAIGAAYVTVRAWRSLAAWRARPAAKSAAMAGATVLLALLFWQLSTLWTAYPDYLPYFNEAVPHPERVLVDSDLDWGQDLYRLELRAAQLRIPKLSIAYRGTEDLRREPLPLFTILAPARPQSGWVAISELARTRNPADYAWLNAYRPLERIGKSIDLYYIP